MSQDVDDERATWRDVMQWRPLIVRYVYAFTRGWSVEDREEAMNSALNAAYCAVRRYDATRGALSTCIVTHVKGALYRMIKARKTRRRAFERQIAQTESIVTDFSAREATEHDLVANCPSTDRTTEQLEARTLILNLIEQTPTLTKRELQAVNDHLLGYSYRAIGKRLHVSQQYVHQLYTSTITKLRKTLDKYDGTTYNLH